MLCINTLNTFSVKMQSKLQYFTQKYLEIDE